MDDINILIRKTMNLEENQQFTYTVLIVDDYPENLIFVSDLLKQHKINVTFATNGKNALLKAKELQPDLILLDIAMPQMDGYEICQRLKDDDETQHIPVIFVTAKVETEDVLKGFEVGGTDYITKPFNLLELLSRIKIHLENKNRHDKLMLFNRKLIDTVKQNSEELRKANERLSKLDKTKNDFLLHINHQLRTPLNGILGYVELLSVNNVSPENSVYVDEIKELVKGLVKLSERSLLYIELKAGTYEFKLEEVNPVETIKRSLLMIEDKCQKLSVEVKHRLPDKPISMLADDNLFFKCCNIILENALKYSPLNSSIFINYSFSNDAQVIEIRDMGKGMSDEARKQLFEAFAVDSKIHRDGFGLGLATAKLIMDTQQGELLIDNPPEGGTLVKLVFYS